MVDGLKGLYEFLHDGLKLYFGCLHILGAETPPEEKDKIPVFRNIFYTCNFDMKDAKPLLNAAKVHNNLLATNPFREITRPWTSSFRLRNEEKNVMDGQRALKEKRSDLRREVAPLL